MPSLIFAQRAVLGGVKKHVRTYVHSYGQKYTLYVRFKIYFVITLVKELFYNHNITEHSKVIGLSKLFSFENVLIKNFPRGHADCSSQITLTRYFALSFHFFNFFYC